LQTADFVFIELISTSAKLYFSPTITNLSVLLTEIEKNYG